MAVYDKIVEYLTKDVLPKYEMLDEAIEWIKKMIDYTVPGGKLNRGLTVVDSYVAIAESKGEAVTAEKYEQACVLGWCVEWLQAFFLVADDVMDESVTRRGQACWYRLDGVGNIAINDSFILEACIRHMLKRWFGKDKAVYGQLLELFMETTWQTELGQLLDLTSAPLHGKADLDRFTIQRHTLIVKYKTSFYSFYLPVALGMVIGGIATDESLEEAKTILVDMGVYFQVQDDYLDCYQDPEILGKIGTDIKDNKCGWLVVQALDKCNDEQRALLKEHYGRQEDESEAKVKELYRTLKLEEAYHAYEAEAYARLTKAIEDIKTGTPAACFTALLNKIYKRQK
jgi:farnesyl diphosphate synthase